MKKLKPVFYKYGLNLTQLQEDKFEKYYNHLVETNKYMNLTAITELDEVVTKLSNGEKLPEKNKDHSLVGNYVGKRECHITPDWLLIYEIDGDKLFLYLTRTGTHSDLFSR